jgi:hypothetical protein
MLVVDTTKKGGELATAHRFSRPMRSLIIGDLCSDMPNESSLVIRGTISLACFS